MTDYYKNKHEAKLRAINMLESDLETYSEIESEDLERYAYIVAQKLPVSELAILKDLRKHIKFSPLLEESKGIVRRLEVKESD
jgi:hypothetical protein